jgi:hypothetical protein
MFSFVAKCVDEVNSHKDKTYKDKTHKNNEAE